MMALMRTASRTAEHVALFRALETRRRDRLFVDDYATRFLPARYRWLARAATISPIGTGIARLIDHRYPGGPRMSAVARTRLIDDLLAEADPEQVLILGAGYDSRAHRIPGIPTTFEVDHPATQLAKRRRIADRPHVRYIPVDLNEERLKDALAGFPRKKTAVIWEGVTNYLTEDAVDATLRDLADLTAPGSTVIFTYVDRAVLDDDSAWHRVVRRVGEPWTFGFHPGSVEGYLGERGLGLRGDLSTQEAAIRYHREAPAAGFYRVAWAVVR
jgi:methyltransferase (TIGR00027 family)